MSNTLTDAPPTTALLRTLGLDNFVELTTTNEIGKWSLVVTKRRGAYAARTFVGELADIVSRAFREDDSDASSR